MFHFGFHFALADRIDDQTTTSSHQVTRQPRTCLYRVTPATCSVLVTPGGGGQPSIPRSYARRSYSEGAIDCVYRETDEAAEHDVAQTQPLTLRVSVVS